MSARPASRCLSALLAAFAGLACLVVSAAAQDIYTGEIRCVAFDFAPVGWAKCEGQLLSIDDYYNLYTLIGTTYGGDGVVSFALPDLRRRVVVGAGSAGDGQNYQIGQILGQEYVSLTTSQLPVHNHYLWTDDGLASTDNPTGQLHARGASGALQYGNGSPVALESDAIEPVGSNYPHENRPPFLVSNYIIALDFTYPTPFAPGELPHMEPASPAVPRFAP